LTAVLVAIATAANAARLTGYWAVCDSHRRWLSRPGIVPSDVLADAVAGQGPFAARGPATDLRVLFAGQADMFTLVAHPASGIRTVADLRGTSRSRTHWCMPACSTSAVVPPLASRSRARSSSRRSATSTPRAKRRARLKHGPIAVIEEEVPVIVLAPANELFAGKKPQLPWLDPGAFRKAAREAASKQDRLPL
jgi:hypothetical protein